MNLIDICMGDKVTINGVSGIVTGINGLPGKVAFIDIEPEEQRDDVFLPAFQRSTQVHL